ncbi:DUF427 domain-containing protein [Streptomyces sp. TRM70350]|uniref:DUF427 domain-containing protein n=1 Tax=Streptomyces sp. TRM70350 TaxID=2856165 RepID=UPI00210FA63D|nr:DUF427 domain-containing protein [Streptomyces sp. TRM70350]
MMRAIWNGVVIAETPRTKRVEGNHYFPPESLKRQYFIDSPTRSLSRGRASLATTLSMPCWYGLPRKGASFDGCERGCDNCGRLLVKCVDGLSCTGDGLAGYRAALKDLLNGRKGCHLLFELSDLGGEVFEAGHERSQLRGAFFVDAVREPGLFVLKFRSAGAGRLQIGGGAGGDVLQVGKFRLE